MSGMTSRPESPGRDAPRAVTAALAAVPERWRPQAARVLGSRIGRWGQDAAAEFVRVQVFDRAMTLAAQAFTSVLPLLIMVVALVGPAARKRLTGVLPLPEETRHLLDVALVGSRSGSFGLVGGLIVVLSATSLTRALTRAYAAIWSVRARTAGPAATGRQILSVLALSAFVVGSRLLGTLSAGVPAPGLAAAAGTALADAAIAAALPRMLLGPVVTRAHLLVTGALFGATMVGVRAAGSVYLPRALRHSADRYGTIGLAFTSLGWLYVIAFCLLLTAVIGRVSIDAAGWRLRRRPAQDERENDLADAQDEGPDRRHRHQRAEREAGGEQEHPAGEHREDPDDQ
jgi:membrane protein